MHRPIWPKWFVAPLSGSAADPLEKARAAYAQYEYARTLAWIMGLARFSSLKSNARKETSWIRIPVAGHEQINSLGLLMPHLAAGKPAQFGHCST
jgi:hypothetical protein